MRRGAGAAGGVGPRHPRPEVNGLRGPAGERSPVDWRCAKLRRGEVPERFGFGERTAGGAASRDRSHGSNESPVTMFAVIEDGSRQYRVSMGETLAVDYRAGLEKGAAVTFDRVLLANAGGASAVGRPTIPGALVQAEVVVPEVKGPKLEIQKFRRRKNSRRHTGHRQKHTSVRITAIHVPGLEVAAPPEPPR